MNSLGLIFSSIIYFSLKSDKITEKLSFSVIIIWIVPLFLLGRKFLCTCHVFIFVIFGGKNTY